MSISDETVDKFASLFCPYYHQNYGVQHDYESHKWNYKRKNMCSILVKNQLKKNYWIAVPSTWYIPFSYIDTDDPEKSPLEPVLEVLNLKDSERLIMSSPGYLKDGKTHTIFKPRYTEGIMTRNLFHDMVIPVIKSTGNEIFPHGNRLFRVPAGRDQHILDENGYPLELSPEEFMYWIDKMDPYEVTERITHQTSFLPKLYVNKTDHTEINTIAIEEARILEKHGLQRDNTRHESCLIIAKLYYRFNFTPKQATKKIKSWIRKKHNGYSKEVNKLRWWFIDKEIEEIVSWSYKNTGSFYPDTIHNFKTGLITTDYVKHAVEVYRGDWINIKRTIALFQYCYMRKFFPWIYIPFRVWGEISSRTNYIDYQNDLSKKGIIKNVRSDYRVGFYPKSFQIALPKSFSSPITNDNRAVTKLSDILLRTFGTVRNTIEATGINRQLAWELFNRS